jgi:hypothetical protein
MLNIVSILQIKTTVILEGGLLMRLLTMSRITLTLGLLSLLVTFWGCTKPDETKTASSKNEPAQSPPATLAKTGAANTPGPTSSAPSVAVIASADGEKAGTRVDITELKRSSDNTLTLKFVMVNDSDKELGFGYDFGDKANEIKDFASIGGVNLVDGAGKKKYFVVRDTENNCVCSRDLKDMPPRGRANLWAKFPAPPDNVQKISIVIPHFGPIDDAPISR